MKFSVVLAGAIAVGTASAAAIETRANEGSYTISGLGNRKKQLTAAGAKPLDMAIAMLETNDMVTSDYPYGDGKTGDATNFGIFKQNWGLLRVCCNQFKGQSTGQVSNGAVLNSNLSEDIQCLHDCQSYYGLDLWFAGHRDGSSGLSNPNTQDIQNYKNGVYWIEGQLTSNSGALTNDVRYWVDVTAI